MNEAIQLLENQGDPLSTALALKYQPLHCFFIACHAHCFKIASLTLRRYLCAICESRQDWTGLGDAAKVPTPFLFM
jgi:hypothetical protein